MYTRYQLCKTHNLHSACALKNVLCSELTWHGKWAIRGSFRYPLLGFAEQQWAYGARILFHLKKWADCMRGVTSQRVSHGLSGASVNTERICASTHCSRLLGVCVRFTQNAIGLCNLRLPLHATLCFCFQSQWTRTKQEMLHSRHLLNGIPDLFSGDKNIKPVFCLGFFSKQRMCANLVRPLQKAWKVVAVDGEGIRAGEDLRGRWLWEETLF